MVEFTVIGVPAPQGSHIRTKWGVRDDNPNTRPWRAAVAAQAAETHAGQPLLEGPLTLDVVFRFPRPKAHYRTGRNAGTLKESAPMFHSSKPDLDKLIRAIGDALTGVLFRDDSQIAGLIATKSYGEPACATILIREATRKEVSA